MALIFLLRLYIGDLTKVCGNPVILEAPGISYCLSNSLCSGEWRRWARKDPVEHLLEGLTVNRFCTSQHEERRDVVKCPVREL